MNDFDTINTRKDNVGPGWQPLIEKAITYLDESVPGWQINQIKEKFGTLRFYWQPPEGTDLGSESIAQAQAEVYAIEGESEHMCETCGAPAPGPRSNPPGRWLKNLCDKHYAEDAER